MQNNNKHLRNNKILLIIILLSVQLMNSRVDNDYTSFMNSMDHRQSEFYVDAKKCSDFTVKIKEQTIYIYL